ncbi:rhodopsin-like [Corticium candelabrum]|uniref:rhodopsin-like n=1 Tax=Corticium candelabrum TaxID=121492 RepID=UPI002E258B42|nr:rhodopsin-like [Corticium candelabrum]
MSSGTTENDTNQVLSPFLPHFISRWEYYTYTSFVCAITAVATTLCFLTLMVACRSPKTRTVTNMFVFNLAAVSLLGGTTAFVFSIASMIISAVDYSPPQSFCRVVLFFSLYPLSAAMWGSAGIAIDRSDVMTRPLSRRLNHRKGRVIIALTWFLPLLVCIPGVAGWGDIVYQAENDTGEKILCYIDPVQSYSFVVFWAVLGILAPTGLIIFCYCVIIYIINRKALTRRALMHVEPISGGQIANAHAHAHFNKTEAQAFRIAFVILLSNVVFTAPFVVILLLKLDVSSGGVQVTHMVTVILLDICIAFNSFLYTFGVRSVRNEIEIMCHCKGKGIERQHFTRSWTKSTTFSQTQSISRESSEVNGK